MECDKYNNLSAEKAVDDLSKTLLNMINTEDSTKTLSNDIIVEVKKMFDKSKDGAYELKQDIKSNLLNKYTELINNVIGNCDNDISNITINIPSSNFLCASVYRRMVLPGGTLLTSFFIDFVSNKEIDIEQENQTIVDLIADDLVSFLIGVYGFSEDFNADGKLYFDMVRLLKTFVDVVKLQAKTLNFSMDNTIYPSNGLFRCSSCKRLIENTPTNNVGGIGVICGCLVESLSFNTGDVIVIDEKESVFASNITKNKTKIGNNVIIDKVNGDVVSEIKKRFLSQSNNETIYAIITNDANDIYSTTLTLDVYI